MRRETAQHAHKRHALDKGSPGAPPRDPAAKSGRRDGGARGQLGDCWVRLAPLPRGGGYEFVDEIVGGSIPRQYIPAVDKGIQEASIRGVLAGFPLVDFKVEVYDGSYHTVDSNEMSFKMAGILAFKQVA